MLRPTVRTAAVAGALALLLSSVAWAAGMGVTSQRLTAAPVPAPAFHPTGVAVTVAATGGWAPARGDVVFAGVNRAVNPASVCGILVPGVPLSGFTVTLANGPVNDTLTVSAGPAACGAVQFGTFDLGTGVYLTSGSATFTDSSITVVTTPPSLRLTLGRSTTNLTSLKSPTLVRFLPASGLTDSTGNLVRGTAGSTVQF